MNIYLVLDGLDSIGVGNFIGVKKCLVNLIEKVVSYGVKLRYGLVIYVIYFRIWVKVFE